MKVFSKAKWLECARIQLEDRILSQAEVQNAIDTWVDACDGKTQDQLGDWVNPAWFEDIETT